MHGRNTDADDVDVDARNYAMSENNDLHVRYYRGCFKVKTKKKDLASRERAIS